MRRIFQTVMSLAVLTLAACQPSGPVALTEADKAAIETTSDAFLKAVLARDWAGVAATYTPDAVLMPPNSPAVEGRDNIQAFFEAFPPVSEMSMENVEVAGQDDMAYVRGTYTMTIVLEGAEPIIDSGKYLEVRQKQADGLWLLHRDIFNSDLGSN